jgi:acyl carrier protein
MSSAGLDAEQVKARLRDFIVAELIQDPLYSLSDDEPLFSGGLVDSLAVALIAVFIEGAFGVNLPDTDLTAESMDTVSRMASLIAAAA